MEENNFWCIDDIWETIQKKASENNLELSDSGVGLAWANEWQKNLSIKFINNREKRICTALSLEVWYYPRESYNSFENWFHNYICQRKKEFLSKGKKSPILPLNSYRVNTKYMGKRAYFTGFYKDDKETIKNIIVPQTGIIADESFTNTTDFLIMGPNRGPAKIEKAIKLGIPCISVEVFVEEVTTT